MTGPVITSVLCIEDEPELREALVEDLIDYGYQVSEAASGRAGLDSILASPPDVVICDCLMPEMNGLELLSILRDEHPELGDLPFIFLSAHAGEMHGDASLKTGAFCYLTKPVEFDLLRSTIEAALAR